ncbi:adenosine deaminase-like protein [Fomitiporia mediterranea MF3/22]|uniref:adenosine deaminase-like protein n=1 Tax=Fomitiporia mediterranea (strain MF3/22) TaxID=694068 RepID=UPI00044096D4|nr:adenosine deaminase-like protein [Fomitiporia mediterranea MF3/22]EJD06483.1 adenosine deaminase-like protein [Fomitiporia mediterranea MF3/22]
MSRQIFGPSAAALASLSSEQIAFIQSLPKAELHAHLNGCIPLSCLKGLASTYIAEPGTVSSAAIDDGIQKLREGVNLETIGDFFSLFTAIYALTSTRENLARATRAVLEDFLDGADRQCTYLELRSTPRSTPHLSRAQYVETVLDEVEKFPEDEVAYILSLDRKMPINVVSECIDIAIASKLAGRRIVAIDLCGDPLAGDMNAFSEFIKKAKTAGLGLTLHVAETESNTAEETMQLLSLKPERLGHATFLDEEAKKFVFDNKIAIEICLTSNILCKTVKSPEDHHLNHHFSLSHPVAICTDDTLPFRNSLLGEYALLLAEKPIGLGLKEEDVRTIARMSMDSRFIVLNNHLVMGSIIPMRRTPGVHVV